MANRSYAFDRNKGELTVDHRNSPGITWDDIKHLPAHVRDTVPLVGEGQMASFMTKRCSHCGAHVHGIPVQPHMRKRELHMCHRCCDFVCDVCLKTGNGECHPFEELADALLGTDAPKSKHPLFKFFIPTLTRK